MTEWKWTTESGGIQMLIEFSGADINGKGWAPIIRWDLAVPRVGDYVAFSNSDRRIEGMVEKIIWQDDSVMVWVK